MMPRIGQLILVLGCACCAVLVAGGSPAASAEYNPVRRTPISIGPEAHRLIVGFRATWSGAVQKVNLRRGARGYSLTQAQTSASDAWDLAQRAGLAVAATRQITPSMHVLFLQQRLYGADVIDALAKLRADPQVEFAAVDGRRYALGSVVPDDPLFVPTPGTASGQWYLGAPNPNATVEGMQTTDLSATDAVDAWGITEGSTGIVIADVDTGVRFDHPDLLRAGQGGRLLPGYDFVGQDFDPTSGAALGTFLSANDGDGWDPDPSDPGDWIDNTDLKKSFFANDTAQPSSWHGTRVVGVYGALTNNGLGVAGMTWSSWILPVRALGKGGGYDSDIIAGIQWAAGMTVTNPDGSAVPSNPYPADIINLSIGGDTTSCAGSAYESALTSVTQMGVLVVIAAGNGTGSTAVELPGDCAGLITGVMTVAGLRNVGTKVGYSSLGPEVSVSAPAGNCINTTGNCLRSIDTTTNDGKTGPGAPDFKNDYTNEQNPNLGTSFATPIVSGIAALMRSVNNNLTPAQLASRIELNATAFPAAGTVPMCTSSNGANECSCLGSGLCGAGMVNAYQAVQAAQRPIAAVALPAVIAAGSNAVFDASGSAASCGRKIASYSWAVTSGSISVVSGAKTPKFTIIPGSGGTFTLTVTDDANDTDTASITVTSNSASSTAPSTAGTAATACPTPIDPTPIAPTITQAFSPATVRPSTVSTLTLTFTNANGFALTQSNFTQTLPTGLTIATSPAPATTCTGVGASVSATASAVTLSNAIIPANGSCTVTANVSSSAAGTYTNAIAASALMTAPAGGNVTTSSSALTVTAPPPPSSGGGGGALDWLDLGVAGALLVASRRRGGASRKAASLIRASCTAGELRDGRSARRRGRLECLHEKPAAHTRAHRID